MNTKLFTVGLILLLLFGASISLSTSISNSFSVHQTVWGYVEYSDGSWVPNDVIVTITDLDNSESTTVSTQSSGSGHTGVYMLDVYDIDGENGHTIRINISYGGCTGNNSVVVNTSQGPSIICNVTIYGNLPPAISGQPSGPTNGLIETSYTYNASTTDPNNDNIYYWFNWDDGNDSGWIGPYASGTIATASHTWSSPGIYQVKVKAKDVYGAELGALWSDPLNVTISSPNNPPNTPSNPDPYDGEIDVDVDHDLSWDGGDPDLGDTVTYDVYFEADDPTPDVMASNNQSSTTYDPGTMDGHTQYYWKIVAWDNYGACTEGPVWDFITENNPPNTPSNPNPEDGATDVDTNADLSWICSDPDGDDLTYDIYFEANDPTPDELVSEGQTETTYDPGTLDYNTHYYWKIIAWDGYGASTTGSVWDFATGSEPNDPPYSPDDPNPEDEATGVDIDADLGWICSDPDGDDLTYDIYFEANDPTPDELVSEGQTETTYDPGTLDYETIYYWQIIAKDSHSATTKGPVWYFTTGEKLEPDLDCSGTLGWTNVPPGKTVTGSFTVENIGDPESLLDWEIESYPEWGAWTFDPENGEDLTPEDDSITVNVEVIAPNKQNQQFNGEVKIVNSENSSDYHIIFVSLATPVNLQLTSSQSIQLYIKFSKSTHQSMQVLFGNLESTGCTTVSI